MNRTFYVCSYGGCGSKLLCSGLKKYGNIEHIHSRYPPLKLEYVTDEWFNGVKIPNKKLKNYTVIYIYKNPVKSIFSRFYKKRHLRNIQVNQKITMVDVIKSKKDLYGINEFFCNYTFKNPRRNYNIICVRYEDLFEKQDELSKLLNIGSLNFEKKETERIYPKKIYNGLNKIYKRLIKHMEKRKFITIV